MTKLYADDMMICEIPAKDVLISPSNDLWPNTIKYKSSISSTEYPPWNSLFPYRTNCCNCGAPLPRHGKCLYCDTENNRACTEPSVRQSMNITASGITMTCEPIGGYYEDVRRDVHGRLQRVVRRYE